MFPPVPQIPDFIGLESEITRFWTDHAVFERSMSNRADAEEFTFYEGPPTANGRPGLHHIWARVYKDIFCRFQTMRGKRVDRRAGWDTHGLPVEVEVEKPSASRAKTKSSGTESPPSSKRVAIQS